MLSIKITRVIKKPTMTRISRTRIIRVRIIKTLDIPTPIHRELPHSIPLTTNQLPQPQSRPHPTRITTTHTHNRYRITLVTFKSTQLVASLSQSDHDTL